MRDFLLVQISIDNANRAGVLANLTLKEFRRASKEDDRFVVNVREHKTFHMVMLKQFSQVIYTVA